MMVIEVDGLAKRFGSAIAVDGLSFAVGAGTVTGFLGPNGAGKTTTLRVLLGLVRATSGRAVIWGKPYRELGHRRCRVGAVLEDSGAHPGRTVTDHLRVRCAAMGAGSSRIDAVLADTGMGELADRRAVGLSLGERQRLGLAAALLGEPEVLILDEPANGLDPAGVLWLRGFLRRFGEEGHTVLVSSHILAEVAQVADQAVLIDRGHLISAGPVTELIRSGRQAVVVRTPRAGLLGAALRSEGAAVRAIEPDRLDITGLDTEQVATLAAALGIPIYDITTSTGSLEEAFLRLTGAEGRPG
jgi:ABC-2 type transport system ATP-binding protein